ncbi:MAG TPA: hypothetical protein VMP01_28305 [Pirellulaceae bacterium]|nr:hypothetical protein [Pirellulaceae bacterium]
MNRYRIHAHQFFSREIVPPQQLGLRRTSPRQRPEVVYEFEVVFESKPFETNFAQFVATRPDIGAHQFIDQDVDFYLTRRWPYCLSMRGTVNTFGDMGNLLPFARKLLWTPKDPVHSSLLAADQLATTLGYRREFIYRRTFDIDGNRVPSMARTYASTEVGEPVGPGVVTLPDVNGTENENEFVWSQILPFPNRTTIAQDRGRIAEIGSALKRHYNGYNELKDARRHVNNGEIKAGVRSAASAVDAVLRFYCSLWGTGAPPAHLPFDEKIEHVLRTAGRPSYRAVRPRALDSLLYLYRCRNSMHEGDCYYSDNAETRIQVQTAAQLSLFVEDTEEFVLWIDALA